MTEQKPMTYREIKAHITDLSRIAEYLDHMPRAVQLWITHEVLPAISATGEYRWPDDLDQIARSWIEVA